MERRVREARDRERDRSPRCAERSRLGPRRRPLFDGPLDLERSAAVRRVHAGRRQPVHGADLAGGDRDRRRSAALDQAWLRRDRDADARRRREHGRLRAERLRVPGAIRGDGRARHALVTGCRRFERANARLRERMAAFGDDPRSRPCARAAAQLCGLDDLSARAAEGSRVYAGAWAHGLRDGLHAGQSLAARRAARRLLPGAARPLRLLGDPLRLLPVRERGEARGRSRTIARRR